MKPARILVVDDNFTNLKLVSELLAFEGYEVLNATDAEEAQVVIASAPPDLVLMDIALPGMDGLTLTRFLKADPGTSHIRIVALTAFAMKGDDKKAYDAGCDGYITKPIDTRALPVLLREILHEAGTTLNPPMNILVIEHHLTQCKTAHHVLQPASDRTCGVSATDHAFAAIQAKMPEIILLELASPDTDQLSLIRRIRDNPATRDIHVVAVTSCPEEFTKAAALAAGCDAWIPKHGSQ